MEHRFRSGALTLAGHLVRPRDASSALPGLVLAHGFPAETVGASAAGRDLPELADRIAQTLGWVVLAFCFRGAGESEGDFSLGGWRQDLEAAIAEVSAQARVGGTWVTGFGTGGALAVCAGAADPAVQGVAAVAAPADFDDWANQPRRLLEHAREIGIVRHPRFPAQADVWVRELRECRPVAVVGDLAPRPLLVLHGSDDEAVPHFDARVLSDAHGSAELRIIGGAGHQLRHDPRAVAVLLGWLDRQKHGLRR